MKRFLFVVVDGGGNVPAELAIARRLAGRGHDVHVLADPSVQPDVLQAGCRFHSFVKAPARRNRDRNDDPVRDWEASSPIAQARQVGEHVMFGPAAAYARDVLDAAERLRPDAIAVDCLLFGAIVGAEKSGVPAALLVHFPMHGPVRGATPFGLGLRPARGPLGRLRDRVLMAASRRMLAFGLTPVNEARRELGLTPLDDVLEQLLRLNRSLVLTSREFDFVPEGLPLHVRYVGLNSTTRRDSTSGVLHRSWRGEIRWCSYHSDPPTSGRSSRSPELSKLSARSRFVDLRRLARSIRRQARHQTTSP
jgi:UDP:flavonoid glycosyltransferase YjiC (YdhE family)